MIMVTSLQRQALRSLDWLKKLKKMLLPLPQQTRLHPLISAPSAAQRPAAGPLPIHIDNIPFIHHVL